VKVEVEFVSRASRRKDNRFGLEHRGVGMGHLGGEWEHRRSLEMTAMAWEERKRERETKASECEGERGSEEKGYRVALGWNFRFHLGI
jgi:hypothetical protein